MLEKYHALTGWEAEYRLFCTRSSWFYDHRHSYINYLIGIVLGFFIQDSKRCLCDCYRSHRGSLFPPLQHLVFFKKKEKKKKRVSGNFTIWSLIVNALNVQITKFQSKEEFLNTNETREERRISAVSHVKSVR